MLLGKREKRNRIKMTFHDEFHDFQDADLYLERHRVSNLLLNFRNIAFGSVIRIAPGAIPSDADHLGGVFSIEIEKWAVQIANTKCPANLVWLNETAKFPDLKLCRRDGESVQRTTYGIEIKACNIHAKEYSARFWQSVNQLKPGHIDVIITLWCFEHCQIDAIRGQPIICGMAHRDAYQLALDRGRLHFNLERGRFLKEPHAEDKKKIVVIACRVRDNTCPLYLDMVQKLKMTEEWQMEPFSHQSPTQRFIEKISCIPDMMSNDGDSNCGKIGRLGFSDQMDRIRIAHPSFAAKMKLNYILN